MMAAAGILGTSVLHVAGADVPSWFDAGKVSSERTGIPGGALFVAQMIMYHFVEIKRLQDFKKPGSQAEPGSFFGFESAFKGTGDKAAAYPGGPMFDPLGLGSGPSGDVMKLREIKNGRLAMLATLGFAGQYAATGKDPLVNVRRWRSVSVCVRGCARHRKPISKGRSKTHPSTHDFSTHPPSPFTVGGTPGQPRRGQLCD